MNKRHKILFGLLLLSLVLLCGCGGDSGKLPAGTAPETEPTDESQETPAPEDSSPEGESEPIYITFEGTDLKGNPVSQEIFPQSRLTMVNVWATYCNPCLREMPGLGELASSYDSGDFQLIGIISDVMEGADEKTLKKAEDLVTQTGADYPHLLLNESLYTALLKEVSAVPTTFFVDQDGQILDTVIGAMEKSGWEETIDALLEE